MHVSPGPPESLRSQTVARSVYLALISVRPRGPWLHPLERAASVRCLALGFAVGNVSRPGSGSFLVFINSKSRNLSSFFASQLRELHIGRGLRIGLDGVEHVSKIGALMSSETLPFSDKFDAA